MKELAWELAETSRTLRRHFDRRASALGVTTAQWRALAWLGHEPGLKQVELAERLDVEPITAGRIVDRWSVYSFYDIFSELGLAPPWWELSKHLVNYKPE